MMELMAEEKTDETGTEEDTEVSFEDALSQLEEVVHRMETGEAPSNLWSRTINRASACSNFVARKSSGPK